MQGDRLITDLFVEAIHFRHNNQTVFLSLASDDIVGFSGDFGSGVGWEDEEEKETEDAGEEAEEEEGETGEADDGGYIW